MNIKLNLEDKMLNPGVINLRQFTSDTDTLVFLMPDYIYETTDLSKLDCYAICDMPVTEEDYRINETKLVTEVVENVLQITWNITGYTTAKEGTITYQIVFKDKTNEQTKIWLSDKAIIFVNSSVNVDGMLPAMFPDILMQWEERMKQTDSDCISNLEETIKQVNLAKEEVSKAEAQVNLAKQEVTKATEHAELATVEANRSKQEADKSKEQADKAELIKSNVEQLVGYDPVDAIGQEVMQARGVHNLLGDRLTGIETDVDEKYKSLQEALSTLSTFKKEVVDVLPAENIDTDTIYFVPKTEAENDIYDEYIYINGKWEHIGSTAIDLSNYYQKSENIVIPKGKSIDFYHDLSPSGEFVNPVVKFTSAENHAIFGSLAPSTKTTIQGQDLVLNSNKKPVWKDISNVEHEIATKDEVVASGTVTKIVTLTYADYQNLREVDSKTLYLITG